MNFSQLSLLVSCACPFIHSMQRTVRCGEAIPTPLHPRVVTFVVQQTCSSRLEKHSNFDIGHPRDTPALVSGKFPHEAESFAGV